MFNKPKTILTALFAITILATAISGCKKDPLKEKPVACFAAIADSVLVNNNLTVDASCSQGVVSYAWDFGDGTTAATSSATHTYTSTGTYTITLTVTNSNGTNTKTKTVVVKSCSPGYEGANCSTEIRAKYIGTYLVNGNYTCSSGAASNLNNLTVTVSALPNVTQLQFVTDYGGYTDTFIGDIHSNGIGFNFNSQQPYPGYAGSGMASFSGTTLAMVFSETNISNGVTCQFTLSGLKQ